MCTFSVSVSYLSLYQLINRPPPTWHQQDCSGHYASATEVDSLVGIADAHILRRGGGGGGSHIPAGQGKKGAKLRESIQQKSHRKWIMDAFKQTCAEKEAKAVKRRKERLLKAQELDADARLFDSRDPGGCRTLQSHSTGCFRVAARNTP